MPPHGLTQYPAGLLETTLDQLRTLLAVHEEGTALGAARLLGREQSSVQKQLDTMNRNVGELCGEPLLHKSGRGRPVRFTRSGEQAVELARATLGDWLDGVRTARARAGRILTVGSTRFTLEYLREAVDQLGERFAREGVEVRTVHVRTTNLLQRLETRELDLVCGSVSVPGSRRAPELEEYDVMEWRRSGLCLLTNLRDDELPRRTPVRVRALAQLPLAVPTDGLICDFLRGWFGPSYHGALRIAAEIDSAQYGFELLGSRMLRGAMLVTRGIGQAVDEGRLPEARGLRTVELAEESGSQLRVVVGAFARADDRAAHPPGHPLNQLWDVLHREHARRRGGEEHGDRDSRTARPSPLHAATAG